MTEINNITCESSTIVLSPNHYKDIQALVQIRYALDKLDLKERKNILEYLLRELE